MSDLLSLTEEQRLELLVKSVTDYAIYLIDPSGQIVTWNSGAVRFKGYKAEEIVGQSFSKFFTDDDRAKELPQRALRIAAREGRFETEGWRVRKDGTQFWAHVVLDAIRSDTGELLGFAKITRDITEKRDRETALFESEQRFRMLVQGVREYAIYMLDVTGRISNWNSGAEAIKGYSADEIVGEHFSRFYTEDDRAAGEPKRALETALREGKYEREAWRVRKDGSLFWASVVIDPIYDESGVHIGFAKITRDATDRKKAQDELLEARAALAQSQKLQALGQLTGGIAHDFNNLMTVISGATDFLLRRPDLSPDKKQHYLEAIADTAKRATTLTDHLLAFGRRQAIRPEAIEIHGRLKSFAEVLSRTLGSKIELILDLQAAPDMIEADQTQLETAILNAAINARDAMPSGGKLTISTANVREGGSEFVRIAIRDTGLGMPQRVIERAFEPFFTTKEVGKGTGLGLSQIHGFAAQAGGRAEIESREGEGTTIALVLPATEEQAAPAKDNAAHQLLPEGLCVLLVEDNLEVREFAEELLRDLGCDVMTASTGQEALDVLEEKHVDLIFSDVVMPGMTGVELAKTLREKHIDIPVVLATGYSQELVNDRPDVPVIAKPFNATMLQTAMIEALGKRAEKAA